MSAPVALTDVESFVDGHPWEQYRWLRDNAPVYRHPEGHGPGFWAVTRHADVQRVSRDTATFSSWLGGIMIPDPDSPELLDGARHMMLYMDPPQHTRYRQLVNRGFTPRSAATWTERIEALAAQIVDEVVERGECDLVADLAGELPSYVIAELMGIPLADGRRLYELTEIMHSADPGLSDADHMAAVIEMHTYAGQVAADKRKNPGHDLASSLVTAEVDGERLSDEEFNWFFLLLLNAGGDTTRNLVAGGMEALFTHPAQRARLAADLDGLLPTAVEELLRWVSPVVYMRRTATVDTELGGRRIAAGDKVVMYYGAANRDPAVFDEPDAFDVGRAPNPHIAFGGGGAHFCLGAHFARIEIAAMLRQILSRLPDIAPAGPREPLLSTFIAGPRRLPVTFAPGPRRR